MSNAHNFTVHEYKTDYSNLQNLHRLIFCTQCGYVCFNSNNDGNDERQEKLPPMCIVSPKPNKTVIGDKP